MTRDFLAELEKSIKRSLSERETAAMGGLVIADLLPSDRRQQKRWLRRAREEARRIDLGLNVKK
jgi:hypothetical protein